MRRDPEQVLDEYLVVMGQAGARAALRQLVARWSPRLLRYVARTLGSGDGAEDVLQEVWASALRGLPGLSDSARFRAWIYAIATRKCADAIRLRRRRRRLGDAARTQAGINGHALAPASLGLDLTAAIRRLPPDQRVAVSLHYGEDLAIDEIAAVLGVPAGTVKSRLHAARGSLKLLLEGTEP
jgi:RNA polymerase sigma-70 factor (ECF subfamily)